MDLKGIYTADANRYGDAEALYKTCGKSGVFCCLRLVWGRAQLRRSGSLRAKPCHHPLCLRPRSPTSTLPTTMVLLTGSAEETMGRLMKDDFLPYRDELFISTKAGYDMWEGPYGNWGSRKIRWRASTRVSSA